MKTWFIKYRLQRIGKQHDPDSVFIKRAAEALRAQGYFHQQKGTVWSSLMVAPRKVAAVLVAVIVSFGTAGTAAFAYGSEHVLPDHPLYPMRTAVERLEYALTFPNGKPEVERRHIKRRLHEMKSMPLDRPELLSQQGKIVEKNIKKVVETAMRENKGRVSGQKTKKIDEKTPAWIEAEAMDLSELLDQIKEARQAGFVLLPAEELEKQLELLDEGLEALAEEESSLSSETN
jgi:hypothetical protein